MSKKMLIVSIAAVVLSGLVILSGCQNSAQTGAGIGALAGAGIGQLAGGDTESTLIGAGIGTAGGYIIGNEADKKKAAQEREQISAEQDTVTVWITNSNGSMKQVTLRKSGPGYVGPRGEYYPNMPSKEDLKMVYGF